MFSRCVADFLKSTYQKSTYQEMKIAQRIGAGTPSVLVVSLRLVWTMEFFMFTIFKISWFLSARGSVIQVQAKIKIFSSIYPSILSI